MKMLLYMVGLVYKPPLMNNPYEVGKMDYRVPENYANALLCMFLRTYANTF